MRAVETLKKILALAIFLIVIVFSLEADATTYIVFRYDDLSADRPGERESNPERQRIWKAEQAVDGLFHKFGFPYVIAVIPKVNGVSFAEDTEKVDFLNHAVQAGRVEVAQHGFAHINHAKANHRSGEFRERSYEDQFKDILQGKEILSLCLNRTRISTFVPPFNEWGKNTAQVIEKLGFSILSADRFYYDKEVAGLTVIPFTAQLWELESKVNQKSLPNDAVIVVLFHPTQIVRTKGKENRYFGVERFEKLLQTMLTMQSVKIVTLKQLATEDNELSISRYQAANNLYRLRKFWSKLLPQDLWPGETDWYSYVGEQTYASQVMRWNLLTIALITGFLLGGLILRYLIGLVVSIKWHFSIDIIMSLLFVLAVLKEIQIVGKGYHITGIPVITAFFSMIFLIALISVLLKKPRSVKFPDEHQSEIRCIKHNGQI